MPQTSHSLHFSIINRHPHIWDIGPALVGAHTIFVIHFGLHLPHRSTDILQDLSAELSDQPGSLVAFHCDLNESEQIETLFSTISEQFGGIDVCINNAGLFFAGSLLDGDVEKWRTMLNVNVLAAAHCAKLAIRSMRDRSVDEGQVSGAYPSPITALHLYVIYTIEDKGWTFSAKVIIPQLFKHCRLDAQ